MGAVMADLRKLQAMLKDIHPDLTLYNMDAFLQHIDLADPKQDLSKPFPFPPPPIPNMNGPLNMDNLSALLEDFPLLGLWLHASQEANGWDCPLDGKQSMLLQSFMSTQNINAISRLLNTPPGHIKPGLQGCYATMTYAHEAYNRIKGKLMGVKTFLELPVAAIPANGRLVDAKTYLQSYGRFVLDALNALEAHKIALSVELEQRKLNAEQYNAMYLLFEAHNCTHLLDRLEYQLGLLTTLEYAPNINQ